MKTFLPTLLCSLALALGFTSCVPIDPYYDGGGYQSGGGYSGGSYGGGGYNNGYAPRPSYNRPYYGGGGGYSSGYDRYPPSSHSYDRDHYDHNHDRDHGRSSSNKKEKNDTLYKYRGKNGPSGNHTIDWWHSRGYQRSQLDFAD
jgi:hypothetical protein